MANQLRLSEPEVVMTSTDEPFADRCSACRAPRTPTNPLRTCACKAAVYCNETCQYAHWREHEPEHRRLRATPAPQPAAADATAPAERSSEASSAELWWKEGSSWWSDEALHVATARQSTSQSAGFRGLPVGGYHQHRSTHAEAREASNGSVVMQHQHQHQTSRSVSPRYGTVASSQSCMHACHTYLSVPVSGAL